MKIITGIYGGRRFEAPRNLPARPTTDLAKQALFNILAGRVDFTSLHCLDLFAGTGSISFELLSREARHVTAVEVGRLQQQFILRVAEQLGVTHDEFTLVRGDVFRFLKGIGRPDAAPFQLIFADPPYDLANLSQLPDLMVPLMDAETLFVLEHGKAHSFAQHPNFVETRAYGAVHFTFFRRAQP